MLQRKKSFAWLQEYNKRKWYSLIEKKETEISEKYTESIERKDKEIEKKEELQTRLPTVGLIWNKPEKNKRTIKGISKTIYYRKFGTFSMLVNAFKKIPKITSFWSSNRSVDSPFVLSKFSVSSNKYVSKFAGSFTLPLYLSSPLSPSLSPFLSLSLS